MRFTYDPSADAAYIYFIEEDTKVVTTQGEWPFNVDIDSNGDVVGIEIMDAAETLSDDFLSAINAS